MISPLLTSSQQDPFMPSPLPKLCGEALSAACVSSAKPWCSPAAAPARQAPLLGPAVPAWPQLDVSRASFGANSLPDVAHLISAGMLLPLGWMGSGSISAVGLKDAAEPSCSLRRLNPSSLGQGSSSPAFGGKGQRACSRPPCMGRALGAGGGSWTSPLPAVGEEGRTARDAAAGPARLCRGLCRLPAMVAHGTPHPNPKMSLGKEAGALSAALSSPGDFPAFYPASKTNIRLRGSLCPRRSRHLPGREAPGPAACSAPGHGKRGYDQPHRHPLGAGLWVRGRGGWSAPAAPSSLRRADEVLCGPFPAGCLRPFAGVGRTSSVLGKQSSTALPPQRGLPVPKDPHPAPREPGIATARSWVTANGSDGALPGGLP